MGKFAALEVKVEAIEIPPSVMVVVMRWRMARGRAGGGGGVECGISASFHPLCREREGRQEVGRSWKDGERGTLNYNPLRDTAEFAFKIK